MKNCGRLAIFERLGPCSLVEVKISVHHSLFFIYLGCRLYPRVYLEDYKIDTTSLQCYQEVLSITPQNLTKTKSDFVPFLELGFVLILSSPYSIAH